MSFSSTDCTWKDEWAEVRAAREARTAGKKNVWKGQGAGAKVAAAAAAVAAAPAKAAAAAAAAEKAAEKAAAKEAAKAAAVVAAAAEAEEAAAAKEAAKAAWAQGESGVPQYQPGDIEVSGCGREGINGTYRRGGLRDGVPCYKRVGGGRHKPAFTIERTTGDAREWSRLWKVLCHSSPRRPPWTASVGPGLLSTPRRSHGATQHAPRPEAEEPTAMPCQRRRWCGCRHTAQVEPLHRLRLRVLLLRQGQHRAAARRRLDQHRPVRQHHGGRGCGPQPELSACGRLQAAG